MQRRVADVRIAESIMFAECNQLHGATREVAGGNEGKNDLPMQSNERKSSLRAFVAFPPAKPIPRASPPARPALADP